MKKIVFLISVILISKLSFSQDTTVNWQTFEQVSTLFGEKQKPIVIFCYIPGDSACQRMIDSTFNNSEVANYINVLFYAIKFDITTKDTIIFFNGQKFGSNGQIHSLAQSFFGNSNVTVPSIIVFDKTAQGQLYTGFRNRDSIFPILIYFNENIGQSTTYEKWEPIYFKAYPPGKKIIMTRMNFSWLTMQEMLNEYSKQHKKVFIDIYYNNSIAQNVMRMQVYNKPEIAKYLSENYYCVSLNYNSDEQFDFKGLTYKNSGQPYNLHQFAIAALNGKMQFPAFILLDEDLNLLDRIQVFTDDLLFQNIIEFFGSNSYKTMNFETYIKQKTN